MATQEPKQLYRYVPEQCDAATVNLNRWLAESAKRLMPQHDRIVMTAQAPRGVSEEGTHRWIYMMRNQPHLVQVTDAVPTEAAARAFFTIVNDLVSDALESDGVMLRLYVRNLEMHHWTGELEIAVEMGGVVVLMKEHPQLTLLYAPAYVIYHRAYLARVRKGEKSV